MNSMLLNRFCKGGLGPKAHFSFIIVASVFCITNTGWSDSQSSKATAVYVAFHDEVIHESYVESFKLVYSAAAPDIEFVVIGDSASDIETRRKNIHNKMLVEVERLHSENRKISHLIIGTHGATWDSTSILEGIGDFNSIEVSSMFRDFFAPLKGLVAKEARIILDACSTLCGREEVVSTRLKRLMEYFGNSDGAIYGTLVDKANAPPGSKWHSLRKLSVVIAAGLSIAALSAASGDHIRFDLMLKVSAITYAFTLLKPAMDRARLWLNRGRISFFEKGELKTINYVNEFQDFSKIHGFEAHSSCFRLGATSLADSLQRSIF
jgi:hypothetical protein